MRGWLRNLLAGLGMLAVSGALGQQGAVDTLSLGGARLQVEFRGVTPDLPKSVIEARIQSAAEVVAGYYGRFPVASARVVVSVSDGGHGVQGGTTWGDVQGFPGMTRLRVGQHVTEQDFMGDWKLTHELVHMALISLPDEQSWLEEGLASYVEPIARAQSGQLSAERVWGDMVEGMPQGEPQAGDRGMNRTHTWGRTYWGGALFCLVADVEILKRTGNARGLQDALRAIVEAGGTIDKEWPVDRALSIGDKATGTTVLEELYAKWSEAPVEVDLAKLWKDLGVRMEGRRVSFDEKAPLARIRVALTMRPESRHKVGVDPRKVPGESDKVRASE